MTNVRGSKERVERKNVISDGEFSKLLEKASKIETKGLGPFFRLRLQALLCVLRLFGKRRGEIARLERSDFKVEKGLLHVTFTLEKKRKKQRLMERSEKAVPLADPLTKPILEYLAYLDKMEPTPEFFLPRVINLFGAAKHILREHHIGGRHVHYLVRSVSEKAWPHLFRETVASDVIKSDPSIIGAFKVQRRLDLKDPRTGFRYLKRFAIDVIERQITQESEKVDVVER